MEQMSMLIKIIILHMDTKNGSALFYFCAKIFVGYIH